MSATLELTRVSSLGSRPTPAVLLAALLLLVSVLPAIAAEKPRVKADDFTINAEINPSLHRLKATARVHLTALDEVNFVSLELHNALRVTRVTDQNGKSLSAERISQENSIRIQLAETLHK